MPVCMALLALTYFVRGILPALTQSLNFIWAPLASATVACLFSTCRLGWLQYILTQLGIRSMGIWFLHALFFTFSTRNLFLPLIDWVPDGWLRVIPILALSYIMAVAVNYLYGKISGLNKSVGKFVLKS